MFKKISLIAILLVLTPFLFASASNSAEKVAGLVLLQVEDLGQLWYVNPGNLEKYYMRNNEDVFRLMKYTGLGISEATFKSFNNLAPKRLAGRILLRVEANGEAYYVNPRTLNIHFLGRPDEAFKFMASLSVGAKNEIINQVKINQDFEEPASTTEEKPAEQDVNGGVDNSDTANRETSTTTEETDTETSTTTEEVDSNNATSSDECIFTEEFFSNKLLLGTPTASGTTKTINYDWGLNAPEGLSVPNKFSARWTGNCYFEGGLYKFSSSYNDSISVFIDGVNFMRSWRDSNITVHNEQDRVVEEGYHDVKVEYYDDSGWANISFSWEKIGEAN